jgi:hypothetical protein
LRRRLETEDVLGIQPPSPGHVFERHRVDGFGRR